MRPVLTPYSRSFNPVLLLVLAWMLTGCATGFEEVRVSPEQLASYLSDKPERLHTLYEKELREGPRNMVLNNMQIGVAAMSIEEWKPAEMAFDKALTGIEAVYADNEQAKKARGLWRAEGSKIFKGEPYERAMAYYYRGILYMRAGDFENARACFKAGIEQDAYAEEEQFQCDFALLMFLEGWCSHMLGSDDQAREAWKEFHKYRPGYQLPPPDHNGLILVETGLAPRKLTGGRGGEMLVITEGVGFYEKQVKVQIKRKVLPISAAEDIAWQATTRGGRPMDGILEGQVVFKEINQAIGATIAMAGLEVMNQAADEGKPEAALVGLAFVFVGVAQALIADAIRTDADTRYWSNLPDRVYAVTYQIPKEKADLSYNVFFMNGHGTVIPDLTRHGEIETINLDNGNTAGLAWIRSRPAVFPAATY
jgi:tetratricopeptide (TPR) repeat protein